jgi:hypothetical protein
VLREIPPELEVYHLYPMPEAAPEAVNVAEEL